MEKLEKALKYCKEKYTYLECMEFYLNEEWEFDFLNVLNDIEPQKFSLMMILNSNYEEIIKKKLKEHKEVYELENDTYFLIKCTGIIDCLHLLGLEIKDVNK